MDGERLHDQRQRLFEWYHDDEGKKCDLGLYLTLPNVWIGCSIEDQHRADERIPHLLRIPAAVRFLSCEPLLGPVDLTQRFDDGASRNYLTGQFHGLQCKGENGHPDFVAETCDPKLPRIHWIIVGGESGHGARPMLLDWARSLRDQCGAAVVPFFCKQLGAHPRALTYAGVAEVLVLKDAKGGDPTEWPADLRVREFPR